MGRILIYGANGYSGQLAAAHAKERGLDVIVAGRNAQEVHDLAESLGLPARVFSLDNPKVIREQLQDVSVLLNCAGPFRRTADPLVDACIENGVHYLDITGEVEVIEAIALRDAEARAQGITLMPATGMDVVPTDCVAARLKEMLPDAQELTLAFHSVSSLSHGTAQTMIDNLGAGSLRRENGALVREPLAEVVRDIDFGDKTRRAMSIPWGDLASAYRTTGIPNIRTLTTVPPRAIAFLQRTRPFQKLGGLPLVKRLGQRLVSQRVIGPDAQAREKGWTRVWGEAINAQGERVTTTLHTIEGYTLTYLASVDIAARASRGELPPGYQTPAGALGSDYVLQFGNSRYL